ncbi:MAG: hypothetical protein ACLGH3_05330 [Actinomycetota bacterium]
MQITFPALRRFAAMMLHEPLTDPVVHRTVLLATHPMRGHLEAVRHIYEAGKGVKPPPLADRAAGLARLRHRQRAIVFMTQVLRLCPDEVAAVIGCKPQQVEQIKAAGMKRLHSMLGVYATRAMFSGIRSELAPLPVVAVPPLATTPVRKRSGLFAGFRRAIAAGAAAALMVLSLTPAGASTVPMSDGVSVSIADAVPLPPLLMAN